jgi:hypothetical protein
LSIGPAAEKARRFTVFAERPVRPPGVMFTVLFLNLSSKEHDYSFK